MSLVNDKPKIVCICGSGRFVEQWHAATRREGLAGHIVLGLAVMVGDGEAEIGHDSPEKGILNELHLRKIDLADEILVLDVDGYTGESTMAEMKYARSLLKPIRFLSEELGDELPNS